MKPSLQPGIAEGVKAFWDHYQHRTPQCIQEHDKLFINECLFQALGTMNGEVKKHYKNKIKELFE